MSVRRGVLLAGLVLLTGCPAAPSTVETAPSASTAAPTVDAPRRDTLAVGAQHTCAIRAGRVLCWGSNDQGQLGDRGGVSRATPGPVAGIEDAVEIDADGARTCVVKASGRVACWGGERPGLVEAPGITTAIQVSVSRWHACAVLRSGEVRCWGEAWLGDGNAGGSGPGAGSLTGIADGVEVRDRCVRRRTGEVQCWGLNGSGEIGDGTHDARPSPAPVRGVTDAIAIAVGAAQACALRRNGEVACWGSDKGAVAVPGITDGTAISARGAMTCVRRATGKVGCWGPAVYGQLGAPAASAAVTPSPVFSLDDATDVAAGVEHACARRKNGELVCWGSNSAGQLGTEVARAVEGITDAVRIVGGTSHFCALGKTGNVACWGAGDARQLGEHLDGAGKDRAAPVLVAGAAGATRIAASGDHTCVVLAAGTVSCWGSFIPGVDAAGAEACDVPCRVTSIADAVDVAAADRHTCVRERSGIVSCWGDAHLDVPRVRRGQADEEKTVTAVRGVRDAIDVVASSFGGCVVRANGSLVCWGLGAIEALEPGGPGKAPLAGKSIASTAPTALRGVRDVAGVTSFSLMTCLARRNGAVNCWNTDTVSLLPENPLPADTEITGLTEAVALRGSLVVLKRGDLAALSADPRNDKRFVATSIRPEIKDAVDVAGAEEGGCAVRKTGEVTCWGPDDRGQLGAGKRGRSETPVEVTGWPP